MPTRSIRMISVAALLAAGCSHAKHDAAAPPATTTCPTLEVAGPSSTKVGDRARFTATLAPDAPEATYTWSVTGGELAAGQGSASIEVDTASMTGKTITATVTVGGLAATCPLEGKASTIVM
jgi:hypothetical protein